MPFEIAAPNVRQHERRLPAMAVEALARFGWGADRVLGGVDVLHATDYVPLRSTRAPLVATVHDVLFATLPEAYTPVMRRGLTRWTEWAVGNARRLVVPGPRAKRDLVVHFGVDPARVDVVAHGVIAPPSDPPAPRTPPESLPGDVVLCVGTLEPRKNHLRVFEAVDLVRARGLDVRLVVAGARGWLDEPILAGLATRPHVTWEGAVSEERKAALFATSRVLAFPSLGEGFGLPVLEGFAAGVPVLVGADTACSDLAGDAALAVDPRSVSAIADGLVRLLTDETLRNGFRIRGRAAAAQHTWERTARLTHDVYERASTS